MRRPAPAPANSRTIGSSVFVRHDGRESLRRPGAGPLRFDLPIARRRVAHQGMKQMLGGMGYVMNRAVERFLVRFRRIRETAQLANELERRRADLIVSGRREKVMKGFYVSAHD